MKIISLNEARQGMESKMERGVAYAALMNALETSDEPSVQRAILSGMVLGLEGQRDVPAPREWSAIKEHLLSSGDDKTAALVQKLSQTFGDADAREAILKEISDTGLSTEKRKDALAAALTARNRDVLPLLKGLLDDDGLRLDAIRAYTVFESAEAPDLLLGRYHSASAEEKKVIIETLATRKRYAEKLDLAVTAGDIGADEIPAYISRSMGAMLGKKMGPELSSDKEAQIQKYLELASGDAMDGADAVKGRAVYNRVCLACHQMYGEGGYNVKKFMRYHIFDGLCKR
ncbi:MAG: hypothetical protein AAF226_11830 [Verrucomicrobiota bacterium]